MRGHSMRRGETGAHPDSIVLQAFVDREAEPAEALEMARHLENCSDCDRFGRELTTLCEELSSLPGAEVPDGFSARVMDRVTALPAPRRRIPRLRLIVPGLAVLALFAAALANPWTVRIARDVGRWLPEPRSGPGEILDLLFALGAAALATLGRAAERFGPWVSQPDVTPGPWVLSPVPVTVLASVLLATILGVALASGGLLRLWFQYHEKTVASGPAE